MIDAISWHKFVRHDQIPAWEAVGWVVTQPDLGPVHGYWSTIMTWPNETDPVMPQREIKIKKETDVFLDE